MAFADGATPTRYPAHLLYDRRWYALRTNPRAEARVNTRLRERKVETFAAQASILRTWSDRTKRVESSLFPGYLFARLPLRDVHVPLSVPGVVMVLSTRGIPSPVRDEEVEVVHRRNSGVEATGELPDPLDPLGQAQEPRKGLVVDDTSGPFQGSRGRFSRWRG